MGPVLNLATAFTTLLCAILLLRAYAAVGRKLLLWSGLCFAVLTADKVMVFTDLVLLPETDLYTLRLVLVVSALLLMLFGLIWESQ